MSFPVPSIPGVRFHGVRGVTCYSLRAPYRIGDPLHPTVPRPPKKETVGRIGGESGA